MNKYIFYLHILFCSKNSISQTYSLFSGTVPNENAIELKWFSKNISLDASFDIYRSDAGQSNWTKINANPIRRATPLSEAQMDADKNNSNTKLLHYSMAFNDDPSEQENNYKFLLISSIMDNELAELCGIYYKDNTINKNSSYDYRLTSAGNNSSLVEIQNIKYNPNYTPTPVANFTGKSGNKIAVFNWNYNSGNPLYKIYRGSQSKNYDSTFIVFPSVDDIKNSESNKMSYQDGLKTAAGNTYFYTIVGLDHFGRESAKSNEVQINILDLTPPPVVMGLRATYEKDKSIFIRWRKPHSSVKKTRLFKSTTRTGTYLELAATTDSFYSDKNTLEGNSSYYYIQTSKENGASSYTDTVVCSAPDFTPPAVPINFSATTDTGYIKLTWTANIEKDLKGYLVFRALSSDIGNFTPLFAEPIRENYFEDRHAKEVQNKIVYKICAMDESYNRSAYTEPIHIRMRDLTAPEAPSIYEAKVENNVVNIVWSKNSALDFMQYEISRGTKIDDSTFGNYSIIGTSRESNFSDRSISPNTEYNYVVVAIDSSNNKSEAASRSVYSKEIKAAEVIQNFAAQKSENSIRLTWTNPKNLEVQVYRKDESSTFIPISSKFIGDKMKDTDLIQGRIYSYKLMSTGDEDDVSSEIVKVEF